MKEFMLLIRNKGEHLATLSPAQHQEFLKECESYIGNLKRDGKLIAAQPFVREGKIISGKEGAWHEIPFTETSEIQVGYYHILASDLDEAISIAKKNPEFEYGTTARIEVRPVKMREATTGFVYPKNE